MSTYDMPYICVDIALFASPSDFIDSSFIYYFTPHILCCFQFNIFLRKCVEEFSIRCDMETISS